MSEKKYWLDSFEDKTIKSPKNRKFRILVTTSQIFSGSQRNACLYLESVGIPRRLFGCLRINNVFVFLKSIHEMMKRTLIRILLAQMASFVRFPKKIIKNNIGKPSFFTNQIFRRNFQ